MTFRQLTAFHLLVQQMPHGAFLRCTKLVAYPK